MKAKLISLSRRYRAARKRLKQGLRANLQPADHPGREAMVMGLETLDLARIHPQVLPVLVFPNYSSGNRNGTIPPGGDFFC